MTSFEHNTNFIVFRLGIDSIILEYMTFFRICYYDSTVFPFLMGIFSFLWEFIRNIEVCIERPTDTFLSYVHKKSPKSRQNQMDGSSVRTLVLECNVEEYNNVTILYSMYVSY